MQKKEEGGGRNRGNIQKGSSLQLVKCKNQKPTVTLRSMMARSRRCCTMAPLAGKTIEVNENAEADEFHARSVPEQGFDELQTTNTELKAEQGFDELRRTTSKTHHQRMLYTPHCQTLVLPVTVNILQRRRLSGRLFEKLCHSPAETFGSQGS